MTEPAAFVDHPSGFLALSRRNVLFTRDGLDGFVAYRRHGRHRINLAGVQAPPDHRAPLLDAFLGDARGAGHSVVAVQVREDQVDLFRRRNFAVSQLGTSFGLALAGFSLSGTRRMRLRNRIRRARGAGVSVVELGNDRPCTAEGWAALRRVSGAWLADKKAAELDFMVGELGQPGDPLRRIFVGVDAHDRSLAFITYVPAWGRRPGYLHDLTRRLPDCPPGTMELINATAMERFAAEGAGFVHFGHTPFVVDPVDPPGAHRTLAWLVRSIGRWGGFLYPARTQRDYKMKWAPDLIEREYLAVEQPSLRAVWAVLRVTRAVPWARRREEVA